MAVKAFVAMGPGLAGMAMYVDPENAMNIVWAFAGFGIALVVSFLATLFMYKDVAPAEAVSAPEADSDNVKPGALVSPLTGDVVMLSDVKDEVFSTGVLGKGAAVKPSTGELFSPVDGTVTMVPDTKHAISVLDSSGAEILMHIGMDTVELNGKFYEPQVKAGDTVKKGQLLIKFDIDEIQKAGYDTVTPIVITNSDNIGVKVVAQGDISAGTELFRWE